MYKHLVRFTPDFVKTDVVVDNLISISAFHTVTENRQLEIRTIKLASQKTKIKVEAMLVFCRTSVVDGGSTL